MSSSEAGSGVEQMFGDEHPLHRAALLGDLDGIRHLVGRGADLNELCLINPEVRPKYHQWASPLMAAAGSDAGANAETMRLLIELGADPLLVSNSFSVAYYAAGGLDSFGEGGDANRLRYALELGSRLPDSREECNSLLCHIARHGDPDRLKILLDKGFAADGHWDAGTAKEESLALMQSLNIAAEEAGINFAGLPSELEDSVNQIRLEMDQEMHARDCSGPASFQIPLFCAAEGGNIECVELLIQTGADPFKRDNSQESVLYAATTPEIVKLFARLGVPVEDENYLGWSPLVDKLSDGEEGLAVALALIEAGANVNGTHDHGYTVFMSAVGSMARSRKVLESLVAVGADPFSISELGYNAFHAAIDVSGEANAEESVREIFGYLHELGVDINGKTNYGLTPLARALREGTAIEVQVLCELGADVRFTAPMHKCGAEACSAIDQPLIFHAAVGIGVDNTLKTRSLLKHNADPLVIGGDGCPVLTEAISRLCSDIGEKKFETKCNEVFNGLSALVEPDWPKDREEYVDLAMEHFVPFLEKAMEDVSIESDYEFAGEMREDALRTVAVMAAYVAWYERQKRA